MLVTMIILGVLGFILFSIGVCICNEALMVTGAIGLSLSFILSIVGTFTGFINYPPTEGTHQGIITAVDLEGVFFRRYEVYLKSNGYTGQSDETVYKIYDYETELAQELRDAIGKTVKLHYGHDGGYIGVKSCGTYHIKDVEIIEEVSE